MKAQLKKVIVEVIKEQSLIGSTEAVITAKGTVVSKGPTCECDIEEKDVVLFSGHAGRRFQVDGDEKEYLVLNQDEVLVKL